ncbi:N-acetylmuramoyl-L-alanine amidase family protein [Peptostreptococcaceae bacterium AGR-M142]
MKKYLYILNILIIFVFGLISSSSAYEVETREFIFEERLVRLPVIDVNLDSKKLQGDVPGIIYKERSMIPLRFLSEELNYKISWDEKTNYVVINTGSKEIRIRNKSKDAYINGEKLKFSNDMYPIVVNDRIMVPVQFVKYFDIDYSWDSNTRTINLKSRERVLANAANLTKLELEKNNLVIKLDRVVGFKDILLKDPKRLVVDLDNTVFRLDKNKYEVNGRYIKTIRGSQFENSPIISRIVIDLKDDVSYRFMWIDKNLYINFSKDGELSGSDITENQQEDTNNEVNESSNNSTADIFDGDSSLNHENQEDIYIESDKNKDSKSKLKSLGDNLDASLLGFIYYETDEKSSFVIKNGLNFSYKSFFLSNPQRMVIDFKGAKLDVVNYIEEEVSGSEFVKSYRSYYYEKEDKTRVVLVLKDHIFRERVKIKQGEGNLVIYQQKNNIKNDKILYNYYGKNSTVKIIGSSLNKDYSKNYYEYEKLLKLKIPNKYIDLKEEKLDLDDNFVDRLEVDNSAKFAYIYIYLKDNTKYEFIESEEGIDINLSPKDDDDGEIIIAIDAGHGGYDSGAISPIDGTKEKEMALKTTLKLEKALKAKGYKVYLLRDKDYYVDLYERAYRVNEKKADLFISIHYNAMGKKKSEISGIETLFYPSDKMENIDENFRVGIPNRGNRQFAKTMQSELIKFTNAKNRGIVERPKLIVTREVSMPAVLVECGFLDNETELNKVKTESYQQKLVNAMVSGVEKYLKSR